METWKTISTNDNYAVSNYGRIKRALGGTGTRANKLLKPFPQRDGYLLVRLCGDGENRCYLLHRLVLAEFIGSCPKGKECNHIDGNKSNNHIDNLEWVTKSENIIHALANGLRTGRGEGHKLSKLKEGEVTLIRKLKRGGSFSNGFVGKMFRIHNSQVSRIFNRITWKHI